MAMTDTKLEQFVQHHGVLLSRVSKNELDQEKSRLCLVLYLRSLKRICRDMSTRPCLDSRHAADPPPLPYSEAVLHEVKRLGFRYYPISPYARALVL